MKKRTDGLNKQTAPHGLRGQTLRVALCGILAAVSLILGAVERLLPPLSGAVPGVKLGLANLPVLLALELLGPLWALSVSMVRAVLGGLLFGGPVYMLHGLFGALLAWGAMAMLQRTGRFGLAGISVVGGACHNVGQWCVAYLLTRSPGLWSLLPLLCAFGAGSGFAIGLVAGFVAGRMRKIGY